MSCSGIFIEKSFIQFTSTAVDIEIFTTLVYEYRGKQGVNNASLIFWETNKLLMNLVEQWNMFFA